MALNLIVSKPRMVLDAAAYFPYTLQLKNGSLFVQLMWGNDRHPTQEEFDQFYGMNEPTTAKFWEEYNENCKQIYGLDRAQVMNSYWAKSTDGGKTFTKYGLPPVIEYIQKENGDIIGLSWYSYYQDGAPIIRSWTSHDNCQTWDAPYDIPLTCPPIGGIGMLCPHRRILHLEGDTYLVLVYGRLEGDAHDRSMVFRTTDGFKTLHYYSTIATWNAGMEHPQGLNETDLVRTEDGRLLAVIRNQGYCPLYQAHSSDDGATWTPARLFVDAGVDPALCKLDNGVVVCSYGRPGVKVAFSENDGDNWQKRVTLLLGATEKNGVTGAGTSDDWRTHRSCCYTDLAQTAPNVVTVFYTAPVDWNDAATTHPWDLDVQKNFRIYAVDITVDRG